MPTTRAASRPSLSAMRRAESKPRVPSCNRVSTTFPSLHARKLQVKLIAAVSARPRYNWSFVGRLRQNPRGKLWRALAVAGMLALAGGSGRAQSTTPAGSTQPGPRPPAQDLRRARQAYEQGLRAERAGDWKSAYAAQTEAEAYAPPV